MRICVKYISIDDIVIRSTVKKVSGNLFGHFLLLQVFSLGEHIKFFNETRLRDDKFNCDRYQLFALEQIFLLAPKIVRFVRCLWKIYTFLMEKL